ncbi:GNAT family N-acetyltransferase [Herbiconiux sp. 11R-BC]|uniref:GNAT family N-acetyltransferase n=1 Tax=Herbiconiux sp. 11R-BC TaxID=3111637 RepID=UPI003C0B644D
MESPVIRLELELAKFDLDRRAVDRDLTHRGFSLIRPERIGDADASRARLHQLAQLIVNDSPRTDPVENGFWEFINAQSIEPAYEPAEVVVAVHDDQWVGFSITDSHGESYVLSDSVWVAPAYRRRGLAISMVAQAAAAAHDLHVPLMRAEVGRTDDALLAVYHALGFTESPSSDTP